MRLVDQIRAIRHTFDSNRGRTALTLLGIMIGVGSIVFLASLLAGAQEALLEADQFATGNDVVQVEGDDAPAKQSRKTRRELTHVDGDVLDSSPLLPGAQVTSEKTRWTRAYVHKEKKRVALVAAEPMALSLHRLEIAQGRFISADDLARGDRVAVIGANVASQMFDGQSPLGQSITVDKVQWTVVGVLKSKPGMGGANSPWMWNSRVLVPRSTFDAVFANAHVVDEIYVRVADGPEALPLRMLLARGSVASTMTRRHYGVQNFKVDPGKDEEQQTELIIGIIKVLLVGTGLLSLFVGGINIMNIMLVTVTERTREIGIRRAIGASPTSILMQFLLEAALISVVGGISGVLGGLGLAWLVATGLSHALVAWAMHVEVWSIVLGLALSLCTGIAFGLLPAWRAAALDPVVALRYE